MEDNVEQCIETIFKEYDKQCKRYQDQCDYYWGKSHTWRKIHDSSRYKNYCAVESFHDRVAIFVQNEGERGTNLGNYLQSRVDFERLESESLIGFRDDDIRNNPDGVFESLLKRADQWKNSQTASPTTSSPTTSSPTISSPTTSSPTTSSPTISSPTTASPTTFSPTTASPTTFSPTTGSTASPTTGSTASPTAIYLPTSQPIPQPTDTQALPDPSGFARTAVPIGVGVGGLLLGVGAVAFLIRSNSGGRGVSGLAGAAARGFRTVGGAVSGLFAANRVGRDHAQPLVAGVRSEEEQGQELGSVASSSDVSRSSSVSSNNNDEQLRVVVGGAAHSDVGPPGGPIVEADLDHIFEPPNGPSGEVTPREGSQSLSGQAAQIEGSQSR
ncbi:MAG: hypothetical protein O3B09_03135 [Proteobacteria bacterium]|nr:hypothetical protein [Pseudomonadota bacterium]